MFPEFFASSPVIRMFDPLAKFLGTSTCGVLEYRYEDAVRLAGHSCPTVASAFLITRRALLCLYGDALPVRGEIRVDFAEAQEASVTGVIAAIATLVTGATADSGFRGLGGQFNRRDKLFFNQPLKSGGFRFTRLDTGQRIEVAADLSKVPGDPRIGELMPKCLSGQVNPEEQDLFKELWQDRVKRLLIDHAEDTTVFRVFPSEITHG
jgi:hypothetical protein